MFILTNLLIVSFQLNTNRWRQVHCCHNCWTKFIIYLETTYTRNNFFMSGMKFKIRICYSCFLIYDYMILFCYTENSCLLFGTKRNIKLCFIKWTHIHVSQTLMAYIKILFIFWISTSDPTKDETFIILIESLKLWQYWNVTILLKILHSKSDHVYV